MDIIGKWKVKQLNIPTLDGVIQCTPDNMPELRDEPNVCTFSADGSKLTAYDIFPPDLGGR